MFLLCDGDVAAAIATTKPETGIDLLMGIGDAPEGVLAKVVAKGTRESPPEEILEQERKNLDQLLNRR